MKNKKLITFKQFEQLLVDQKLTGVIKGGYGGGCNTTCVTRPTSQDFDNDLDCAACGRTDCGDC